MNKADKFGFDRITRIRRKNISNQETLLTWGILVGGQEFIDGLNKNRFDLPDKHVEFTAEQEEFIAMLRTPNVYGTFFFTKGHNLNITKIEFDQKEGKDIILHTN
jgi:hypothetical protein